MVGDLSGFVAVAYPLERVIAVAYSRSRGERGECPGQEYLR
jgi:hypothetical protein